MIRIKHPIYNTCNNCLRVTRLAIGSSIRYTYEVWIHILKFILKEGGIMKAKIAARGQVTIPLPLRKKLGMRPGVILDFSVQNDKLIAVKADESDSVSQVFGCLGKNFHTDAFIEKLRGSS